MLTKALEVAFFLLNAADFMAKLARTVSK